MKPTHYMRYVVFRHGEAAVPQWCSTRPEAMDKAVELHNRNGGRYFVAKIEAFTTVTVKSNRR